MGAHSADGYLSALFIDFENVYISLKKHGDEVSARFAREPASWLAALVSGHLLREAGNGQPRRRIAVGRCYGNPSPRKAGDAPDPHAFAAVRREFMKAGLEVIDCPHLTAQFKNSSDIRITCEVLELLSHKTHFDEFIILSADADFTPVLLELRAHNRRTVIFANNVTSQYYAACASARIEETDLVAHLSAGEPGVLRRLEGEATRPSFALPHPGPPPLQLERSVPPLVTPQRAAPPPPPADAAAGVRRRVIAPDPAMEALKQDFRLIGREITGFILALVNEAPQPVSLGHLADRITGALGRDKTNGTNWAGSGSFLGFLRGNLPMPLEIVELGSHHFVMHPGKHRLADMAAGIPGEFLAPHWAVRADSAAHHRAASQEFAAPAQAAAPYGMPLPQGFGADEPLSPDRALMPLLPHPHSAQALVPASPHARIPVPASHFAAPVPEPVAPQVPALAAGGHQAELQRSIERIYDACRAPMLPPSEYQLLFELIAAEVQSAGFAPGRTLRDVMARGAASGLQLRDADVAFVIEAVDDRDPWLEHATSPAAVAGAYHEFVLMRCRSAGLQLTAEETQLIALWFAGGKTSPPSRIAR